MTLPPDKRIELILQQMDRLPTLPAVAIRVLEITGNDTSSARNVVELIENDPPLTARILQLVHRADLGVRSEVNSVSRAVVLLGFEAVRSAVLAVSVFETFGTGASKGASGRFDRAMFWRHCMAVACCAELLAATARRKGNKKPGTDPADAFVCGLLHDLGKVALDASLPKSFARVVDAAEMLRGDIADIERSVIGIDHMVVGKRLAERWGLPPTVRDCIWLHGTAPETYPSTLKNPWMVSLVTLADMIVRERHIGYSGNYVYNVPKSKLVEQLGLSLDDVEAAAEGLIEQIEPRAKALGLGETTSSELYRQALCQANVELGRVSDQLAAKNRRLSVRAKFFEALAAFQSELRPDAAPSLVLRAIAQTATGVLGVERAAAFSLPPGRDFAEAVIADKAGEAIASLLVDRPGQGESDVPVSLPRPHASDGPVLPAEQDMEWLTGQLGPQLGHSQRWWICLEADGECIGGVVWGNPAGEANRLSMQLQELSALSVGWGLALRTCQIRDESRQLAEQLAETNRRLISTQNELLRNRTLAVVGEMAAGAAHEMNNPLMVISGRSQLLAKTLKDQEQQKAATAIAENAQRLSDMITELMHFAKPTAARVQPTDAAHLLAEALAKAKSIAGVADRNIEVTCGEVPAVLSDRQQVASALAEVVANAIQATDPKSGQILVGTAYDPFSRRVAISVADNGCGMDDKTLGHAFDPFFSEKPAGRRRGLGLPKAMRWVEGSGGTIQMESRRGEGTRVLILLPAALDVAMEGHNETSMPMPLKRPA